MKLEFDALGTITNQNTFPDTVGVDDLIEEYNIWKNETVFLSVGGENNEHYKNLKKLPPHRILPFVVEIMRTSPDNFWMTDIFFDVCPVIKFTGYVPGRIIVNSYIRLWDECLVWLTAEELDGVCDELAMHRDDDNYKIKSLSKKNIKKFYERLGNLFPQPAKEILNNVKDLPLTDEVTLKVIGDTFADV